MSDRIRVPAFHEHGDRDDASDRPAKPAVLAHCIHDFPQQFLIGDVLTLLAVAGPSNDLAAKAVNLVGRHPAKVVVQRLAGFDFFTVDQQCAGPGNRVGA